MIPPGLIQLVERYMISYKYRNDPVKRDEELKNAYESRCFLTVLIFLPLMAAFMINLAFYVTDGYEKLYLIGLGLFLVWVIFEGLKELKEGLNKNEIRNTALICGSILAFISCVIEGFFYMILNFVFFYPIWIAFVSSQLLKPPKDQSE